METDAAGPDSKESNSKMTPVDVPTDSEKTLVEHSDEAGMDVSDKPEESTARQDLNENSVSDEEFIEKQEKETSEKTQLGLQDSGAATLPLLKAPGPTHSALALLQNYANDDSSDEETPVDFTTVQRRSSTSDSSSDEGLSGSRNEARGLSESDSDAASTLDSSTSEDEVIVLDEAPRGAESLNRTPPKKKDRGTKALEDPFSLDDLPPIENLQISVSEEECTPIGKVFSMVDRLMVIQSLPNTPALMLDTIIFTRDGKPIGKIFDVFGQVTRPNYTIRFNSTKHVEETGLSVGRVVYCAPKTEHTNFVFTKELLQQKGSDASWAHDDEPPPYAVDFSDDEEERKSKRKGKTTTNNPRLEEPDSPARRRHLSFEEEMNRNNTLRNKAYKRSVTGDVRSRDNGWHHYTRLLVEATSANPQPRGLMRPAGFSVPPPPPPPPHFSNPRPHPAPFSNYSGYPMANPPPTFNWYSAPPPMPVPSNYFPFPCFNPNLPPPPQPPYQPPPPNNHYQFSSP